MRTWREINKKEKGKEEDNNEDEERPVPDAWSQGA
jgi:hypothetical protein